MTTNTKMLGLFVCGCAILTASIATVAQTTRVAADIIKVSKRFYVASNGTLLVSGTSSNAKARLFLYRSSGSFLGEVKNGAGGKYGGSVFYAGKNPVLLTIKSSLGGKIDFKTDPYHP